MRYNAVQVKSYCFANRIVKLAKYLHGSKEYILSKQLLKSGTSIWANIEEAIWWQSRKDFYAKLSIAYKECRETRYWLMLLRDNDYLSKMAYESMHKDLLEIIKIVVSIQKSTKQSFSHSVIPPLYL